MSPKARCCCKPCAMKQMGINNRIDQETAEHIIINHPANIHPNKTELISEYKGVNFAHKFRCGNCRNEFTSKYNVVNRVDSLCCCYKCSCVLKTKKPFQSLEEKLELLENHPNNIDGYHGKTIFMSDEKDYRGAGFTYKFCCGDCGNEFDHIFMSIIMSNSTTRCDSCSYEMNGDKLRYSLTELQNMIDDKSICKVHISDDEVKTIKNNTEFYCETHGHTFVRRVENALRDHFCPVGQPIGWSKQCIDWLKTFPDFNEMRHALHPEGEYRMDLI